jgi:hypothetical protein
MVFVRPYFMTDAAAPRAPANPEDAAGPVLDAIAEAGTEGVDAARLADATGLDQPFLLKVLRLLQNNGMVVEPIAADQRHRLTDLGRKARYLVAR